MSPPPTHTHTLGSTFPVGEIRVSCSMIPRKVGTLAHTQYLPHSWGSKVIPSRGVPRQEPTSEASKSALSCTGLFLFDRWPPAGCASLDDTLHSNQQPIRSYQHLLGLCAFWSTCPLLRLRLSPFPTHIPPRSWPPRDSWALLHLLTWALEEAEEAAGVRGVSQLSTLLSLNPSELPSLQQTFSNTHPLQPAPSLL